MNSADQVILKDLLLHRAALPGVDCPDKDIDLTLLPPHLPRSETPTHHLVYDSALRTIHDCIRYSNCATVPSNQPQLDAMGWRTSREMYKPKCRCLGICWS
jgi:hypothetical protein